MRKVLFKRLLTLSQRTTTGQSGVNFSYEHWQRSDPWGKGGARVSHACRGGSDSVGNGAETCGADCAGVPPLVSFFLAVYRAKTRRFIWAGEGSDAFWWEGNEKKEKTLHRPDTWESKPKMRNGAVQRLFGPFFFGNFGL